MMSVDRIHQRHAASIVAQSAPGHPELLRLQVRDDALAPLGITTGAVLEAERGRQPVAGDLVWVELVRRGELVRLLRRYAACEGMVALADPAGREPTIIRQRGEMLISAVVTSTVVLA